MRAFMHLKTTDAPPIDQLDARLIARLDDDSFYLDSEEIVKLLSDAATGELPSIADYTVPELRRAMYAVEATIRDMFSPISADKVIASSPMLSVIRQALSQPIPD